MTFGTAVAVSTRACSACSQVSTQARMTGNGTDWYCGREGDPGYEEAVGACERRQEAARAARKRLPAPKGPDALETALGRVTDASQPAGPETDTEDSP